MGAQGVRVVTLNVLAREYADGASRERLVQRRLAELEPDVVALQEVTRTADLDQAVALLGQDMTVIDSPEPSPDGVGACVATRWPVEGVHLLDLHLVPETDGLPWASAVAVEVAAPFGPLLVVHHKPNWQLDREWVRERQAVATARFVHELIEQRPAPVIVLGDFDAGPDAASMRFWTGRQSLDGWGVRYEDAWEVHHPDEPGHTFSPANPLVRDGDMPLERGRRIDHILVRSGTHGPLLDVADCALLLDEPVDGIWASDHFGLVADLAVPARLPGIPGPMQRAGTQSSTTTR